MEGWQWKQDYETLVREGLARGDVEHHAHERRHRPRFRLKSQHVYMRVERRFAVVDVSVTGISVYSDFPFEPGQTINITLGKAFSVEAEVVGCAIVEADPMLLEAQYRVQCHFQDEAVGMQFLVMMKQMDDLEITPIGAAADGGE